MKYYDTVKAKILYVWPLQKITIWHVKMKKSTIKTKFPIDILNLH